MCRGREQSKITNSHEWRKRVKESGNLPKNNLSKICKLSFQNNKMWEVKM